MPPYGTDSIDLSQGKALRRRGILAHVTAGLIPGTRLKDIQGRLADEIQAVERLIAASKPVFRD